jgi:16S rRNA (cytosine1402-N4)-methyltransferase
MEVVENGFRASNVSMHVPVLITETLFWLRPKSGDIHLDCTVGYAGLATQILKRTGPTGLLIGIDRDQEALDAARIRLQEFGDRVCLRKGHFVNLVSYLEDCGIPKVNGVIFDLGVSSAQLDTAERGFSFLHDGPLDMRMDRSIELTAADLIRDLSEGELADVIYEFGEERYARRIARTVARERSNRAIKRTGQLVALIKQSVPAPYRHGRIHCATRTFQALRIAVNRELEDLESALRRAVSVLAPEARLCVISFHSLEDRIVKNTFRALSKESPAAFSILTKKPVTVSEEEGRHNPRARSAKLRVGERRSEEQAP